MSSPSGFIVLTQEQLQKVDGNVRRRIACTACAKLRCRVSSLALDLWKFTRWSDGIMGLATWLDATTFR